MNTFTPGDQSLASVTTLKDGGWIVTWNSHGQDGHDYGIYQQRYTADGRPVGPTTPTGLRLEGGEFEEGSSGASSTAQIHVEAFVTDQGFTYTLLDDAEGRFALSPSGVLTVTDGTRLDYEQASSHRIRVRSVGQAGRNSPDLARGECQGRRLRKPQRGRPPPTSSRAARAGIRFRAGWARQALRQRLGNDMLDGGAGKDIFVFDTKPNKKTNIDTIADFNVAG